MTNPVEDDLNSEQPVSPTSAIQSVLPENVRQALVDEADRFKAAQRQVTDAIGLLWNAQLELSIASGNEGALIKAMRGPLSLWDDCSCGCGPTLGSKA